MVTRRPASVPSSMRTLNNTVSACADAASGSGSNATTLALSPACRSYAIVTDERRDEPSTVMRCTFSEPAAPFTLETGTSSRTVRSATVPERLASSTETCSLEGRSFMPTSTVRNSPPEPEHAGAPAKAITEAARTSVRPTWRRRGDRFEESGIDMAISKRREVRKRASFMFRARPFTRRMAAFRRTAATGLRRSWRGVCQRVCRWAIAAGDRGTTECAEAAAPV